MRNLKKVISSVAALAIVASSASAFAITFPDVDASASYASSVELLTALGIVDGDDHGLFNPDKSVTRAEFTKMAVGALGEIAAAEAQSTSKFADAANTSVHWAAGYVAQGVADGFIDGYDDTRFGPDDQVTYAQACKMLVAAIGYTSYAEAAGGWPSGYVSQASSLGITKGVSATNDTNLTRAQCAILIANAMKAPLCVIDEWETAVVVNGDGSIGSGQVPKLKKLDGFNKDAKDYQTLLTDKHDTYVVKGRVMKTSRDGSVDKGEVSYKVEVADNFDDEEYSANGKTGTQPPAEKTFKVGETDAENMLFAYTEAIVKHDEDSDDYTILTITNYGNAKIVEFAAKDLADDDSTIGTDYIGNKKLPVYKTATSTSTTKYDLSVTGGAVDAELYVNGVKKGIATNADIDTYILKNETGTVTLVDETKAGSTSTDGKYEYIMVTYYVDVVADYANETSSKNTVYFKEVPAGVTNKLEWDPDDDDIDITFTKDGEAIKFTDIAEFDVLSIQYDITDNKSLKDKKFYHILVSDNKVTGNVSSKNTKDQVITIDGKEYDLNEDLRKTDAFDLGRTYTAYIDAFGYVAYSEEGSAEDSNTKYGVVVAMFMESGADYPTVRLITGDAKVETYECKDATEGKKFYTLAMGGDPNGTLMDYEGNLPKTKTALKANIQAGKTICTYRLVDDNKHIKFDRKYQGEGGTDLEFKTSSSKFNGSGASYTIGNSSKIVNMEEYITTDDNSVETLAVSDFENEETYEAMFADKNKNDSVYRFVMIFSGLSSLKAETQIAVVQKATGRTEVKSVEVESYKVLKKAETTKDAKGNVISAGDEAVDLYVDKNIPALKEGAIVAYKVGSEGYVEKEADLAVYFAGEDDYDTLLANTIAKGTFVNMLNASYFGSKDKKEGKEININGTSTKGAYQWFGIVYTKSGDNVELFTSCNSSKVAAVSATKDFSVNGARVYSFDYSEKANKGARLSYGTSGSQSNSIFNQVYSDDAGNITAATKADKNYVAMGAFTLEDVKPQLAFIKEVDGDVTDAVFFVAP